MASVAISRLSPSTHRDPLRQSVTSLAHFAMCATGADGYALFEVDEGRGGLSKRHSSGLAMPPWLVPDDESSVQSAAGLAVALFTLFANGAPAGSLAFVFRGDEISEEKLTTLDRFARIIETVQAVPHATASLAARLSTLEAELLGIKIAERARGILSGTLPQPEAIETLASHVERVLEGRKFGLLLEQMLPDLEEQLATKRAVLRAKSLLESRHGMSEEQAYFHLRVKSRSTRRRLSEVAQELIAGEAAARQEESV